MAIFNLGPLGLPPEKVIPEILLSIDETEYTIGETNSAVSGKYQFAILRDETTKVYNWELAILSSGTITFKKSSRAIDIFLVGGGKPGGDGEARDSGFSSQYSGATGGKGGAGGECITEKNFTIVKNSGYNLTIGSSNENTIGFDITAQTGGGAPGVAGGKHSRTGSSANRESAPDPTSINAGTYAFDEETSCALLNTAYNSYSKYKYGAGGGGGGAYSTALGDFANPSVGGTNGGGKGGSADPEKQRDGYPGTRNSGSGGGGGAAREIQESESAESKRGSGGAGGSGIIIIRNAR